jgi:putative intracellular protease/amidase
MLFVPAAITVPASIVPAVAALAHKPSGRSNPLLPFYNNQTNYCVTGSALLPNFPPLFTMKKKTIAKLVILISAITVLVMHACAPLRELGRIPVYQGDNKFRYTIPSYDRSKKTVVIVANNDGTELFDMLAPFYLFNATGKANVYIVAKNKIPIAVKKGFFLLPQSTFSEMDSLGISPDVMVIPFLTIADSVHQDPVIVNWIRAHYSKQVTMLAICDGAATAAATGIYDGHFLTAHASDLDGIKSHFTGPHWVRDIAVTQEGNLFSTAGVSNAAEGSLVVIRQLFGRQTMEKVMRQINYPFQEPRLEHRSLRLQFGDKMAAGKKILFRTNRNIGVLLQPGIDEFILAAVLDSYSRSLPASIESYSVSGKVIQTKYGLTLIPGGKQVPVQLDELHVMVPAGNSPSMQENFTSKELVRYHDHPGRYIFDVCLDRIGSEYGKSFRNVVKLALDYERDER